MPEPAPYKPSVFEDMNKNTFVDRKQALADYKAKYRHEAPKRATPPHEHRFEEYHGYDRCKWCGLVRKGQ
jgi:hypothetical protein